MPIPDNISKEHIMQAAHYIDEKGVPLNRKSKSYDVIIDNKPYPPKYIISIANIFANNKKLEPDQFTTHDALRYLRNLNFKIIRKTK